LRRVESVTSPRNLRDALTSGRSGFEWSVVDNWRQVSRLFPGVTLSDPESDARFLAGVPRPTWSRDGQALGFTLSLTRLVVGRKPSSRDLSWTTESPDVWWWDVPRGELRRLSADDDLQESSLSWAADGQWVAFDGQRTDPAEPRAEVWVAVKGRMGGEKLAEGERPQGSPTQASQLAFRKKGEVWLASLEDPPPPPWWLALVKKWLP
jgi:dipeptidyl aminopeptidase/acylaminoacyl peptidase